ncbi:MAG: hypothetical protein M3082_01045 [Candidatus Dormibacteraeota bacterium]|nr:hypothetical protein [Candidatus Dormibacteraeota bacterium]
MDAGIGALVGAVAGYLLRPFGDWFQDIRLGRKERARRHADSQREILRAAQGCLLQLDRASIAALRANPLQLQPLAHPILVIPSTEDQTLEDALRGSKMVRVQVENSELRTLMLAYEKAAMSAAKPTAPDQAVPMSDARREAFDKANERLGELLRELQ